MSDHTIEELSSQGGLHWFGLGRREFLKVFSGGVLICAYAPAAVAQESGRMRGWPGENLPQDLASWLHIGAGGQVTVFTGKAEMGQNIRTSLAQQVAEELRTPVDTIALVMGDTDLTPYDMGTFGSRTTPTMAPHLRNMAASARDLLIGMAAQRWKADPTTLVAADGEVANPATGQTLSYGELAGGQKLVRTVAADPPLVPAAQWKIAGTAVSKVGGREFVTGKHQYPSDIVRPEMLQGKVLRPSGFNATLVSLDAGAAEKISGVTLVHDGDFVGVAAPDSATAERALAALKAEWRVPPQQPSNKDIFDYLKKNPETGSGGQGALPPGFQRNRSTGSVAEGMAAAEIKLEQRYTLEYIAHAPLEPRSAVAEWSEGKLTVWTGTQRPFGVRQELAEAFRLSADKVRVIQPDSGSGYGGKHMGDAAVEAARLAKAAGKPVKVVWTREEEFTWAYYRPAGVIEIRSGARRDGTLVAWECHNYNSGPSAMDPPYQVPNQLLEFHAAHSPLRQGSYRALAATGNTFARETHIDELAHLTGIDPLAFRLQNISAPRLRAVLEAAADKFGWGREKSSPQRGFGLACGTEKGGYFAACAEVEIDPSTRAVQVRRLVQAWESGAVVNPDGLRNQIGGVTVQALGGALFEQISFAEGRILNPHFSQYRLPRFSDTPQIELVILDRKDLPSAGAGEAAICGPAPAVGNAIFAASGIRLRSLPLVPEGLPRG
jgi:isoquinoline 1-oxidoreductase